MLLTLRRPYRNPKLYLCDLGSRPRSGCTGFPVYFNSGVNSVSAGPNHSGGASYGIYDVMADTATATAAGTVASVGAMGIGYGAYVAYSIAYPYVITGTATHMAYRPLQTASSVDVYDDNGNKLLGVYRLLPFIETRKPKGIK